MAKYAGQPEVADEQADPIDLTSLAVSPTESLVVSANWGLARAKILVRPEVRFTGTIGSYAGFQKVVASMDQVLVANKAAGWSFVGSDVPDLVAI